MILDYTRRLSVLREPDILVCGIGCAGTTAAVAAARMGLTTMAVEQWPFAGGNITAANVNGACGLADMTSGELAVGGIVLELLAGAGALVERDVDDNATIWPIELPLRSTRLFEPITDEEQIRTTHTRLPYTWDIERFKRVADRLLVESGVEVLYHTRIVDVVVDDAKVAYVLIADREGVRAV